MDTKLKTMEFKILFGEAKKMEFSGNENYKISALNLRLFLFLIYANYIKRRNKKKYNFNTNGTLRVYSIEDQQDGKTLKIALSFRLIRVIKRRSVLLSEIVQNICCSKKTNALKLISIIPFENNKILIRNLSNFIITINEKEIRNKNFMKLCVDDTLCITFPNGKDRVIIEYKDIRYL